MIRLDNVNKVYEVKSGKVQALKDVNLQLGDNGLVFILGKSGCGKTTLLNILGGLDSPTSGDVLFDGKSLKDFGGKDNDDYRNFKVGFVFQEYNLLSHCNVGANVDIALELQSQKKELRAQKINDALTTVGLQGYNNRKISELSGGQKQRVAIARALVKNSQIILADEPTGNLDSSTSEEIYDVLKNISKSRLVVVVSHDVENAQKYADRIIKIRDGEISSDEIINADNSGAVEPPSDLQDKKSGRLSFISMLKMSLRNFKKHWFRMLITAILFIATLSLIGSGVALMTKNPYERYVQSYQKVGDKSFTFSKWANDKVYEFSLEEYQSMSDEYGNATMYPMYYASYNIQGLVKSDDENVGYYRENITGAVVINEELIKKFGYEKIAGEFPNSDRKEFCITKYTAESLLANQKKYCRDNKISGINDFVGHTIVFENGKGSFNICGIIDTKVSSMYDTLKTASKKEWEKYYRDPNEPLYEYFYQGVVKSPHTKLFINEYFFENYFLRGATYMYELKGSRLSEYLTNDVVFDYSDCERTGDIDGDDEILLNPGVFSYWMDSKESQQQPDGNYYITLDLVVWKYSNVEYSVEKKLKVVGYFADYNLPCVVSANVFDELQDNNKNIVSSIQVLVDDSNKDLSIYKYIEDNAYETINISYNEIFQDVRDVNTSIYYALDFGGYLLLGVAIFTLLMMLNLLLSTIKGNEKEMGILRAIGAKQSNIFLIYFVEMAIIVLVSWFFAIFVAMGISHFVSGLIVSRSMFIAQSSVMPINFVAVIAMLGFGLLIAFIGSAIPILVKARKKPVELVRE